MEQRRELRPTDLWVLQVLRTASGWVPAEKLMLVLYAVKLVYPMPGVSFTSRGLAFWSPEIEEALRRLVKEGLVEESNGAYRITKRGNRIAEKALPSNGWALPYADVVFYLTWNIKQLAEYISNHHPGNLQSAMERKG
jgi:hypothetical protein